MAKELYFFIIIIIIFFFFSLSLTEAKIITWERRLTGLWVLLCVAWVRIGGQCRRCIRIYASV